MPRRKKAPAAQAPRRRSEAEVEREVAEDFNERQNLSLEGREELAEKLDEHNSLSPEISAGDVDAAWGVARQSGEETFTGHAPTPDQDRVDDLGAAAGLSYKDDEPLQYDKVARRDERRWELDARSGLAEQSMEEDVAAAEDEDDAADADDAPLRFWDLADDLDAEVEEELDDEDDEDEDDDEEEADEDDDALAVDEDELEAGTEVDEDELDDDELESDELEDDEFDDDLGLDELEDDDDDDDDDD